MDDRIYKALLKYDFRLFRGNSDVPTYLKLHLNEYLNDIKAAISGENKFLGDEFVSMLKMQIHLLENICEHTVRVLESYRNGMVREAYNAAYDLFSIVSPFFLPKYAWKERDGWFYRIRAVKLDELQKADMFHIKNESRHLIGAYRYSIPGFPCLYMSSGCELAWFESGMPKQFCYCQLIIGNDSHNAMRLIDFSNRPIDLLSSVTAWVYGAKDQGEKGEIFKYLLGYILTYPLSAACSLQVKQRNSKYVEEYIMPQILMQWVRESKAFDGVRYKSSLDSKLVDGLGADNVALPVKEFRADGLCKNLTDRILVSDIGYFDVNKEFEKYNIRLEEIEVFRNELTVNGLEMDYAAEFIWKLIEVSDTVIKAYDALINGRYENSELMFLSVDRLFDYITTIFRCKDSIVADCINRASIEGRTADARVLNSYIDKFYNLMKGVVHKHIAFQFNICDLDNFEKI